MSKAKAMLLLALLSPRFTLCRADRNEESETFTHSPELETIPDLAYFYDVYFYGTLT